MIEKEKIIAKFPKLLALLDAFHIEYTSFETLVEQRQWDYIVDCIFGFSFKPPLRGIYVDIIDWLKAVQEKGSTKLISIDIPSGWDVEHGPLDPSTSIQPHTIVSLTAPKRCVSASGFAGIHYVTGRFIPPSIGNEINGIPDYHGSSLFIRL